MVEFHQEVNKTSDISDGYARIMLIMDLVLIKYPVIYLCKEF